MRKVAQTAGAALIAALLMTGCSSGSDGEGGKDAAKAGDKPAAKPSASGAEKPAQGGAKKPEQGGEADLDGVWNQQKGYDIVRVTIFGDRGISDSEKGVCSGPAQRSGTTVKFDLKCPTPGNPRTKGTATLVDGGKTLSVSWEGGLTETFTKDPIKVEMPKIDMPKIDVP
ncbi:hypothetical protein [Streptomyces hiroshimensis]|uniref:Lipoprotein n=1 Tax=Streptomyces hiroshimensis TaxID=66424 RepID=A0ABQ2ZCA5_9ACTN|nr:hypothetical protein [Streptomyces hiroshimensis]GGY12047.1 hypothetical protein GCM10010324_68450 [Streptomyces hiroshimensis]